MKWKLTQPEKFRMMSNAYSGIVDTWDVWHYGPTITVGDFTSDHYAPHALVKIFDGTTKRDKPYSWSCGGDVLTISNPKGEVSALAFATLERILGQHIAANVKVKGEEDLLVLPCVLLAPDNSVVLYGDPFNECTRYINVTPQSRCDILRLMLDCGEWSE